MVLFLISCPGPEQPIPEQPTPGPSFDVGIPPEGAGSVILSMIDNGTLKFSDGVETWDVITGEIKPAKNQSFSAVLPEGNFIIVFDDSGNLSGWQELTTRPSIAAYKKSTARDITSEDEVWILEHISPEDSHEAGALYRDHTRILKNGIEQGLWYQNEWEPNSIYICSNGLVIAENMSGSWHNLEGPEDIFKGYDDGIILCNVDTAARTGKFIDENGNRDESWNTNFFNNAKWQKSGVVWYSHNGYTWDFLSGLTEEANSLWGWNTGNYPTAGHIPGEYPLPIPAGTRIENSEDVTYWIECLSGWLIRHVPSADRIDLERRLFVGDYIRLSGVVISQDINPVIVGDNLYYKFENIVFEYDLVSKENIQYAGNVDLIPW